MLLALWRLLLKGLHILSLHGACRQRRHALAPRILVLYLRRVLGLQQLRQQVEVAVARRKVGGRVAPHISQPRVRAAPQQQAGGGQVAVPAGLWGGSRREQLGQAT